jgi:DNA/RNA endonuclease G (NUC1)
MESLYLDKSDEQNKKLAVPEYFWKIVVDGNSKTAIIGTNNIFIDQNTAISNAKEFCKPAPIPCPSWATVIGNENPERGYIFCCKVDDVFNKKLRVKLI